MKKTVCALLLLLTISTTPVLADSLRLGFQGGVELINQPRYDTILRSFDEKANLFPGFYWEVIPGNLGFGMTYLVKFSRQDSLLAPIDYEWYLDWIGSWDFRYHFLRQFPLDPFAEAGFGCAGRVDITGYGAYGLEDERDSMNLSLFGQVGGGLALRMDYFHIGAKALYRFYNEPIPAAQIELYPLKNFHFAIFGGLSF